MKELKRNKKGQEIYELYDFEILNYKDEIKIIEAAEVLTDTFLGVQVGSQFIQEPMLKTSKITYDGLKSFMIDCLKETSKDGLTVVVIEKSTGKVVGTTVAEFYKIGQEKDTIILDGEQEAMNIVNLSTDKLISIYMEDLKMRNIEINEKQYVHLFLTGIRLEFNKKYIGQECSRIIEEEAIKMGGEIQFLFASNFRSQKMYKELLGYELAFDVNNNPIIFDYSKDELFSEIPANIATEGQLLFRKLI